MHSYKTEEGETFHDFRPDKLGWGWNGLSWNVKKGKVEMTGIGKGIKIGDLIITEKNGKTQASNIESIYYSSNPKDHFECILNKFYSVQGESLELINKLSPICTQQKLKAIKE